MGKIITAVFRKIGFILAVFILVIASIGLQVPKPLSAA